MSVSFPRIIPVRRRDERTDAMSAHKDQELDVFKKNIGNSSEGLDLKM